MSTEQKHISITGTSSRVYPQSADPSSSRTGEIVEFVPKRSKEATKIRWFIFAFITTLLLAAVAVTAVVLIVNTAKKDDKQLPFDWPPPSKSVEKTFKKAALSSDHAECSEIAGNILKKHGNAVDAAIAVMFCLGVTNPESSGLGGGFLMTIYNRTQEECIFVNSRETAPAAAHKDMYKDNNEAAQYGSALIALKLAVVYGHSLGFKSIAIPSELAGSWYVYNKYGSGIVPWKDLVLPSVELARRGTIVSEYLEDAMRETEPYLRNFPSMKNWINAETGTIYKKGDIIPRPKLATTLEKIANSADPAKLFYRGEMADTIIKEITEGGGILTKLDLANYKPIEMKHLSNIHFRDDLVMCGGPPPSSFAVTQLIVSAMSELYSKGDKTVLRKSSKFYHNLVEIMKFAYAQRMFLGDVNYVESALHLARNLTKKEYAEHIVRRIPSMAKDIIYYGGPNQTQPEDFGTSHISVLDEYGNAVAATTTINRWFGAVVESEAYGIIWNDQMDDFSLPDSPNGYGYPPSESNFISPGKRPMSSMSPTVIFDKKTKNVRMVVGGTGGSKIISAVAKAIVRHLFFGETLKEAIDSPMLHHQFIPFHNMIDNQFPEDLKSIMESKYAQEFRNNTGFRGVVHAVSVEKDGIHACGDFRRTTPQEPSGV